MTISYLNNDDNKQLENTHRKIEMVLDDHLFVDEDINLYSGSSWCFQLYLELEMIITGRHKSHRMF